MLKQKAKIGKSYDCRRPCKPSCTRAWLRAGCRGGAAAVVRPLWVFRAGERRCTINKEPTASRRAGPWLRRYSAVVGRNQNDVLRDLRASRASTQRARSIRATSGLRLCGPPRARKYYRQEEKTSRAARKLGLSADFSPHEGFFPVVGRAGLQPRRNRGFPASARLAPRATLSDKVRGARDEETITSVV